MYYHASPINGIQCLQPHTSGYGTPMIYFSTKRENTLVYLSNAIEKVARETGYSHIGPWKKWASYGFTKDNILRLEEYYPNATADTYQGVSGYIYSTESLLDSQILQDIPFVITSEQPVRVQECEFIPDAYAAIMEAVQTGKILLEKYEDMDDNKLAWIRNTVRKEYEAHPLQGEYRHFLMKKFPFLHADD